MPESLSSDLFSILLVAIMLVSCFACGNWLLARLSRSWEDAERLLFGVPAGCAALALTMLLLGSLGLLYVPVIWAATVGLGALTWRQLQYLRPALLDALAPLHGWSRVSGWTAHLTLLGVLVLLLVAALPAPTDWDSLMYHLEIPAEFLRTHRIVVPEDNLHVAYVGIWHMLYLPFLAAGASGGPALLNAAAAVMLGLAVLVAADRLFDRTAALIAFLLLWGTAAIVLVGASARIDVALALALFLAHYAAVSARERHDEHKLIAAAGLMGIAIGMKYHALLYFAALFPVAIAVSIRIASGTGRAWSIVARSAIVMLVVALPWLAKNALIVGAPLYPFLAQRLLPPWLAQLAGASAVPAHVTPDVFTVLGQARDPVSAWALLFNPARLTVEVEAPGFALTPVAFLLPIAFLFIGNRRVATLLLPALGYLALLFTASRYINLRYLIPAVPVLAVVLAETARRASRAMLTEARMRALLLAGALVALVPAGQTFSREVLTQPRIAAALGIIGDTQYLSMSQVSGFPSYYAATEWTRELTRPDDRILMLFEARGYYFERDVLQDNELTNWPLLVAIGAPERCLEGSQVTHILVNHGAAAYYRGRGSDLGQLQWDGFPSFAARCLERVHAHGGYELFRVVGATSPSTPPTRPSAE